MLYTMRDESMQQDTIWISLVLFCSLPLLCYVMFGFFYSYSVCFCSRQFLKVGGAMEHAGMLDGDLITHINGEAVAPDAAEDFVWEAKVTFEIFKMYMLLYDYILPLCLKYNR